MAKILFINSVCNGSTGTICKNLYNAAIKEGHVCCIAYGRGKAPEGFDTYRIENKEGIYLHALKARVFDASGFGSKRATKRFVKWINDFKPDIIHLHNIHGYYVNIAILFDYLKKHPEIKKVWTLHDCWPFTGHCSHFEFEKCEQWKTMCKRCIKKNEYPKSIIDRCEYNYKRKKIAFTGIKNLIIITPSKWLKHIVSYSYLKNYPIKTINNGVDINLFKYTRSNIKEKYEITSKKIILGVASTWNKKKGLDTFIELSKHLNDDYKIVLIGLNKKQKRFLPNNIIGINKTENIQELVEWYSAADLFFNPTLEDNYPTVNIEAQLCNTPILTYNTGGCKETVILKQSTVVEKNVFSLINKTYKKEEIIDKSKYSITIMCAEYILIYNL